MKYFVTLSTILLFVSCTATIWAADPPEGMKLVFEEDFENGRDRWETTDDNNWTLHDNDGNKSFGIVQRQSNYKPKYRSPYTIALIKDLEVADFVMTFRVKSMLDTGGHRDCCVFFNHQDPEHFYYVHLGARPDPHSGQIMIVNGAPRKAMTENEKTVPWDDNWHTVKLVRDTQSGTIEIYFDDMKKPHMKAVDKTFGKGRIGIGSFDDVNDFDDIRIFVPKSPNTLSEEEKALGFELLFNGKDLTNWKHGGNWIVEEGAITRTGRGGSLVYGKAKVPNDFELRFEWKVAPGSNSGVYYRPTQNEYQILDNSKHADGKNPRTSAASLYFCMAPADDVTKQPGQWNTGRVVCKGTVVQHWLNGEKVIDFDYADPRWKDNVELLRLRGGDLTARGANLSLQDHGDPVWYRSVRWREIPASEPLVSENIEPQALTAQQLAAEKKKLQGIVERRAKAKARAQAKAKRQRTKKSK